MAKRYSKSAAKSLMRGKKRNMAARKAVAAKMLSRMKGQMAMEKNEPMAEEHPEKDNMPME